MGAMAFIVSLSFQAYVSLGNAMVYIDEEVYVF